MGQKIHRLFFFQIIFLIFLFTAYYALAAGVRITFNPSPDDRVVGYNLYYGFSENFDQTIDLKTETQYYFSDLQAGKTYYFAATAYDNYGNESGFSNIVAYEFPTYNLYYPHIASNIDWETEVCAINEGDTSLSGSFLAYNQAGMQISELISVHLAPGERREFIVGQEFPNPSEISWIAFQSDSSQVVGYFKFFASGQVRVGIPAVTRVNTRDIYVPHIASDSNWASGVALVNTTDSKLSLHIHFDNGEIKTISIPAHGHSAFTIRQLFGIMKPDIHAAIIKNAAGVVGLELFAGTVASGNKFLAGVLLKDVLEVEANYPHVANDKFFNTGIVAFNPSETETANMTILPFCAKGTLLAEKVISIPPMGKYIGLLNSLGLSMETAWFQILSDRNFTGLELFSTVNGFQMAGFSIVDIRNRTAIFPKIDHGDETDIAFVNAKNSPTEITLFAITDAGELVDLVTNWLAPFEKRMGPATSFFTGDISKATYIRYESDKDIVGFQLNSSFDGMLLDAIPGLKSSNP